MIRLTHKYLHTMPGRLIRMLVMSLVLTNAAIAQTDKAQAEKKAADKPQPNAKIEKQVTQKAPNKNTTESVSQQAAALNDVNAVDDKDNQTIDWGDWALAPNTQYGVGIQGEIEAEINLLDQSNLLENATGVATTPKDSNNQQGKKLTTKDLKKMMAELEAMEAKVKKEIEDDTEF